MYICLCNGHRSSDIREAARSGLTCPRAIYRSLGKPVRCGRCLDQATQIIDEVHAASDSRAAAPKPGLSAVGEPAVV